MDKLRGDHPTAEGLVAAYATEMERARLFVATRGLAPIPAVPLDVIATPEFMRPLIPFAAYDSPGPYTAEPRGLFYVTVPDPALPEATRERVLRDHSRHEIAATSLHEGYPGHHLQLVHGAGEPLGDAEERVHPAHPRGVGAVLRRDDGGRGVLRQ